MYEFDEWLGSCPVTFTIKNDNGDILSIDFEVSVPEEEE